MSFSAKQLAAYTRESTEAFCYYDWNEDGKIPAKDIGEVMKAVGQYPTIEELNALLKSYTKGKEVTLKAFLSMVKEHQSSNSNWKEELQEAFNHFDTDKSGTIDTQEIVHAMTKIGQKLTPKQAKDFVKAADADGDGEINYEEFVNVLTSGRDL